MTDTDTTAVAMTVTVDAPIDRAFAVFTEDMANWWPPDHHVLQAPLASMVFEPWAGGRVYDVGEDGSECQWARVLIHEPPRRVVFSWDINVQWQIESDPDRTSEVEVRFVAEDAKRTRVELEHRHLDRHGDGWEGIRDAVGSSGGWSVGLHRFAEYVEHATVQNG
jgi:uncharacterized protein YndB with AHSA1/START domain